MEGMQAECSLDWAATAMEGMQEEVCSLGAVAELEKINDAVESMTEVEEPVNDAVEGTQEGRFVRVAADLTEAKDMTKQLETLFAGEEQGRGGGDAAAGAYQRARALTSTNRADRSPAVGQPEWIPSSGGGGSSRSAVSDDQGGDSGGGGNAPGQSNHNRKTLLKWSTQVRVCNVQDVSPLDDGLSWRKYGQKDILGAKYPRAYYRCTHRNTQGCPATKQVQRTDGDPLLFDVVYKGIHTCSRGSGQFTQGQFERVWDKPGFTTSEPEPEPERPVLLAPPTFSLDPFERASSDSGFLLKYPEKPELNPETMKLEPETTKLEAHIAGQQQGEGGNSAAAGGIQRGRALVNTMCASLDRAMHMITPNLTDGSLAAGQPGWIPSSGGNGSSRNAVSDPGGGGGNAPGQSKHNRKMLLRRSTQVRVSDAQAATYLGDGFSWRKYGQKEILGAKHPRSYYRCMHRSTQGCQATKQVQRTDGDPLLFDVVHHGIHTCSQGSGQFTEGQFERVSPKPGFNTSEPEPERPVFLAPPTFSLDPLERASSDSGFVLKHPEKSELKPETTKLEPETTKLEPGLVKPVLSTFPASKLFGEDRETQLPVYKIPLKPELVWEEKPFQTESFWEEREKRLSATLNKPEPFWEEKPFQTGSKFIQAEELVWEEKPFQMESFWEGGQKRLSATLQRPEPFWEEKPYQTGPAYKDVMAWFAMGKQTQKGRPSHTCMQKAGQELLLGRDDIRQKVMEKILLDSNGVNNCTIISIYGWSGLGKTSLLRALYNNQQLFDAFDKRIWIQISEKVDMVMFFRKIIEFAMNERCNIKNIDILRELVVEEITDKKFLLFLDDADIENQQFWTTLLEVLNTGSKGSVVVMATRSSAVAAVGNVATYSYSLNPLSEESNLMLLQQYDVVSTDVQSNPDLGMMANRFVSWFGYNLLYLKAVGGLLCHTDTFSIEEDKFEGSVMPLRLCHDALPVHLKRCLALCSLFPDGYIFDKHHMVLLWISHGCVRPVEGYELEDVGVEYFNELLCRSFFQCSPVHSDKDDMFVMHELMYNVVASVSRDKYFKSKDLLSSIPENALHCSLISSQFQTVELMHMTEELKDLQTFLALQPEWKPNSISLPTLNLVGLDDFFLKFTSLETLDLSHTETKELPASIAGLRNLRYLSVNNTNVRALPSELCSLSDLQMLEAKHCRFLTELPRDIKKLVKLRHLDLTKELGFVGLPRGIGELTELQTLPVFHVSGDSSRCSISELGSLHNLRGCLWLSGLGSVKTGSKAQEANLKDKHHLKDLTLEWHDEGIEIEDEGEDEDQDAEDVADEQVLESLQPHANLQALTIRDYEGSRFPAWMQGSSPSLPNLATLTLDSCCNCTEFPAIAQLPSLKSLSLRKMYNVRRLSSSNTDPHGDGAAKFPSLELLNLWEMYGLEELFFEESQGDCPRLRKVCISRCPDLKRLPRARSLTELVLHCGQQLPDISELASLASLKIEGFHGVTSFGLPAAAALKKLEIRSCKELSSVDGLSALSTVRRLKITGCPKLVLPETNTWQTNTW